jgi:type III pantothenate kinase
MLIAIDVGNTQTVMGLFDGADLIDQWRLSTVRDRTADEYKLFFAGLLRQDGYRLDDVDGAAISAVVPTAKEAMVAVATELVGRVLVVGPGIRTGMAINIDNPREVGADRVVNSVAARHRYGAPVRRDESLGQSVFRRTGIFRCQPVGDGHRVCDVCHRWHCARTVFDSPG